jgi:hypothetical protein
VPIVFKCGSLDLLETSGPVKVCNEIALLLFLCAARHDSTAVLIDDIAGEKHALKYEKYSGKIRYDQTGSKETSLSQQRFMSANANS